MDMKCTGLKQTICFFMSFLLLSFGLFTTNSSKVSALLDTPTIVQSLDKCISIVNEWDNVNEAEIETIINKLNEIRDSVQSFESQFSNDIKNDNKPFLDAINNNAKHQKDKRDSEKSRLSGDNYEPAPFDNEIENHAAILINMPNINPDNERKHEEFNSRIRGLNDFINIILPRIQENIRRIHELNTQEKDRLQRDLLQALDVIENLQAELDRGGCFAGMKTKNFRNGAICGGITTMIVMICVVVAVIVGLSYAKKV